jgi:rhamnosyl/mannosyltransferase
MEILQVAGLYPPHLGGEETVVQRLADIQAATHRVTVYTSDIGAGWVARQQQCGRLRVVRDRGWRVGNTPVVPRLLGRLLGHRPAPHVVHVHTGLALTPEIVRVASWLRRVPYVAHVHLLVRPSSRLGRALLPAYNRLFFGAFLRRAARVICLTGAMRDTVVATFGVPPSRVAVVPNGVDTQQFGPDPTVPRASRELLFVGRLTAQKNVRLLVEAMALLPRDVTLRLVGEGELWAELSRRIGQLGLTNVHLVGRLPPAEVAAAYRRATAVLLPSSHEGLPLVLLEAMAAGAPVVCSALPELVEVGGDAVLPVDPVTAAGLAAAVHTLLDDPGRRERLSLAARHRAASYGWPAAAAAIDGVYRQVQAEWA